MSKKIKRVCEICGREFSVYPSTAKRGNGRFCSRKCVGLWKKQQPKEKHPRWKGGNELRLCKRCGQEFYTKRSSTQKFCSRQCYWGSKIKRVCQECGMEFEKYPSDIKQGRGKFCSKECYSKWMAHNQHGTNHPRWSGGPIYRICKVCSSKFTTPKSRIKYGRGKFCSRACYNIWLIGESAPTWKGGRSFEPYPPEFNNAFKKMIRERDGHTCIICKLWGNCIHHTNYVKNDTTPENCTTLCRSCHSITNTNREYWEAALSDIMRKRTEYQCINDYT